jgi:hypothetical protein
MTSTTFFTADDLAAHYDRVADYCDGEFVAYRAKKTGLLRIIDADSGGCILAIYGNPFTKNMEEAKRIADSKMAAA